MVHALATTEIRANGARASVSRQRIFPRIHQMQSVSTKGSITTEGLLSVARMKKPRDKTNEATQAPFPDRPCGWVDTAAPFRPLCHLKKKKMENKKKRQNCVFFSSVTQATDCTITGCKLQSAAPSHAPRTRSTCRTRQSSIAEAACKKMLRRRSE